MSYKVANAIQHSDNSFRFWRLFCGQWNQRPRDSGLCNIGHLCFVVTCHKQQGVCVRWYHDPITEGLVLIHSVAPPMMISIMKTAQDIPKWYKKVLTENSSFFVENLSLSASLFASCVSNDILTHVEAEDIEVSTLYVSSFRILVVKTMVLIKKNFEHQQCSDKCLTHWTVTYSCCRISALSLVRLSKSSLTNVE